MKYLAPKLRHRIQILKPDLNPALFGLSISYKRLVRLWAAVKERKGFFGVEMIRGVNIDNAITHVITVRYSSAISIYSSSFGDGFSESFPAVNSKGLGRSFTNAFGEGFDSIIDFDPIKGDYFIMVEGATAYRGRIFKIEKVNQDEDHKEFIALKCRETEERGTGARIA